MNALLVEGKAWLFGRGGKVGRGKIFADHQIGGNVEKFSHHLQDRRSVLGQMASVFALLP